MCQRGGGGVLPRCTFWLRPSGQQPSLCLSEGVWEEVRCNKTRSPAQGTHQECPGPEDGRMSSAMMAMCSCRCPGSQGGLPVRVTFQEGSVRHTVLGGLVDWQLTALPSNQGSGPAEPAGSWGSLTRLQAEFSGCSLGSLDPTTNYQGKDPSHCVGTLRHPA